MSRKFEWTSTANNLCSIYTRLTISDSYYLTLGVWFCPIRNTDTPNVFRNPKRNEIVSPIFQKFPPHVLRSKAIATTSSFPSYILSSHTFCLRCAVVAALSCYSSWRWTAGKGSDVVAYPRQLTRGGLSSLRRWCSPSRLLKHSQQPKYKGLI